MGKWVEYFLFTFILATLPQILLFFSGWIRK